MGLIIWTAAEKALIDKTFGKSLKNFRPDIPEHRFVTCEGPDDAVVTPAGGDICIVAGTRPLDVLRRAGLAHKGKSVTSMREAPIKAASGGLYLVTFDPGIINTEPAKSEVLDWDMRLAVRLMRTGTMVPEIGQYRWVNTYQPMIDWIEAEYERTGAAVDVSLDTETEGFYPWYPDKDIVSISFTARPGTAEVLYTGRQAAPIPYLPGAPLFEQITWLLNSPKVKLRLANGKFDLVWIATKWGIECTNFKFDTLLVGSLLNENRSNSLNLHAKIFTPIGGYDDQFNATVDKGKMGDLPADGNFLTYAGGDTDATQRSADVLKSQLLEQPTLARFYVTVVQPAARAFEKLERRGVLIDKEKYEALGKDLVTIIKQQEEKALDLIPNKIKLKHKDKIESQIEMGKSPLVDVVLRDYFFTPMGLNLKPLVRTEKTQAPSMAKSHLRMFGDVPAAVAMVSVLTEMDSAAKTDSTFVRGFLKHLRPDGRFHPSYMLFHGAFNNDEADDSGTVTGRLSAKDPAFQTLPKKTKWAKRLRECYIAPPGKVILMMDYRQGELKVVACLAPEPTMLKSYEHGMDLHAVTGAQLARVPIEEFLTWKGNTDPELKALFEKYRGNAKPANFGLLYGMGAEGFLNYAWANYGLKLGVSEAEEMRDAFFTLYAGLPKYHDRMKKIANFRKEVSSPLGRVRHLPHIDSWDRAIRAQAERQAINSPVQATLTDMMIWAIALIEQEYGDAVEMVGMIHDAFVAYVDEDKVQAIADGIGEIMQNLPFQQLGWKPQLHFDVDAEIGHNLAEMDGLKLAA